MSKIFIPKKICLIDGIITIEPSENSDVSIIETKINENNVIEGKVMLNGVCIIDGFFLSEREE